METQRWTGVRFPPAPPSAVTCGVSFGFVRHHAYVPLTIAVTTHSPVVPPVSSRWARRIRAGARRYFWMSVALWGILFGLLAAVSEAMRGPLAAAIVGVLCTPATWLLGASVVGFLSATRRRAALGAALFMGATTCGYYLLRWFLVHPWVTGGQSVKSFVVVATVWLLGTVCGGAVVGWLTRCIPADDSARNACGAGVWLGLCLAPIVAYLPALWDAAVRETGREGTDWGAFAEVGSVFGLISSLSAAVTVLVVVPGAGLFARTPRRIALFALIAAGTLLVMAPILFFGTELFDTVTNDLF